MVARTYVDVNALPYVELIGVEVTLLMK